MIENPVRKTLLAGGSAIGVMALEFFTPGLARVLAAGGAEFVILDTEHSGAGMDTLKSAIAYARGPHSRHAISCRGAATARRAPEAWRSVWRMMTTGPVPWPRRSARRTRRC